MSGMTEAAMKCLSVRQPWAWCIAEGHKRIENRSWWTGYRGPLAIHAAKTAPGGSAWAATRRWIAERLWRPLAATREALLRAAD